MSRSYPIWNEVINEDSKTNKSHGVKKRQETNIKIGTSKKNSFNFANFVVKTFTGGYGTICYQFFLDGELIKEASYNPQEERFEMRSKIHPRNFYQTDMLFDFSTRDTIISNKVGNGFIKHKS